MKRLFSVVALILTAGAAQAAGYSVSATWTDPTPAGADYAARFDGECRVNGGAITPASDLPSPALAVQMTATQGDRIECRARAVNVIVPASPIAGTWTAWVAAAAPISPRTPADQTNFSITVTPAN